MGFKKWKTVVAATLALSFSGATAQAEFPEKPITMLVGFGAGGGTDAIGRKIAIEMEEVLGQPIVVVNKPGGGGLVSWQELVAAEPDGHTMAIFLPLNAAIQKYLKTSESWIDPLEDIRLLGMVNADAWGVAVGADQPFDDVEGFVEWARENPGAKVSDGGPATAYHWAWEALNEKYGLGLKTVTYKGGTAGGLKAVAGGEVVAAGSGAPEANSMVRAGLVKMIGIAAEERNPKTPDLTTFKEQGFDFVFGPTRGFAVPAGTPDEVVEVLAEAVKAAYESEGYQSHLEKSGQGGWYLSPDESAAYVESVDEEFKSLIDNAGMLR